MESSPIFPDGRLVPPGTWAGSGEDLLRALRSPWYRLVAALEDTFTRATVAYAHSRGLRAMHMPLTTRTVTCPNGFGSDTQPVRVNVSGIDTYLADSTQFLLEYGTRLSPGGGYCLLPSFRHEEPDETHLSQFLHSEAEFPGDLDALIDYVEGYLRHLASALLHENGDELASAIGDVSHLQRMAAAERFPRLTFEEAAALLERDEGCVTHSPSGRSLTRRGERRLMAQVGEFVWVTHFDHLSVPFYQAYSDDSQRYASNADLFFGIGEVVGAGERHVHGADVRKALANHEVPEHDYAWYVRMKDAMPLQTSGFGMGVDRFMQWVLHHADIRDIPLVSRIAEQRSWPRSVDRP